MTRFSFLCAAALSLAPPALSQLPQSANFRVADYGLSGGFGPASSLAFVAYADAVGVSGESSSPSFNATVGFLGGNDPDPGSSPVIFGLTPAKGPMSGGTLVQLSGINFDVSGLGSTATVDGVAAGAVTAQSNSKLSLKVPAGASGPADLVVTTPFGTDAALGGYLYTPAVTSPPLVALESPFSTQNHGPVGTYFEMWFSLAGASLPFPPFGTILIDPVFAAKLVGATYPAPSGIHSLDLVVPNDGTLHGLTLFYQSIVLLGLTPLNVVLTNAVSTTVL